MSDVVIHARLRCDTELEANSDPPPLDLREATGAPPPVPEFVPLALKESSPELEEKPLGSPGIEISAPTLVLIDPSIGTMYTSESNPDAQCTAPLISRSPRPNPAPSIATIGSMPDAPPMRIQRVVMFDPTNSLPVSEALEVVACLPRYQTPPQALADRSARGKNPFSKLRGFAEAEALHSMPGSQDESDVGVNSSLGWGGWGGGVATGSERRLVELRVLFFHSIWKLCRRRRFSSDLLEPITERDGLRGASSLYSGVQGSPSVSVSHHCKGGLSGYG
ncbi:BQ5605_C017g08424 [Microbotryum silenes-dioicae]|uniref:BQ5605_C017g08424 protein n=1 Tax=Microbotryum silenes-dioicae TaxID=796604 RepID=A0A2X0LZA2_9BASI|nr:BQ5605_C017g08424 [Microbotryum silenes-dioicae]